MNQKAIDLPNTTLVAKSTDTAISMVSYDEIYSHYQSFFNNQFCDNNLKGIQEEREISRPSLFLGHRLEVQHQEKMPHNSYIVPPIILLFLSLLLVYSWIIHKSSLTLGSLFSRIMNLSRRNLKDKDKSKWSLYYLLPLVFISCCSFALLIFQTVTNLSSLEEIHIGTQFLDYIKTNILALFRYLQDWSFLKIFILIFSLFVFKILKYRILTILFKKNQTFQVYWNALAVNSIFFSIASLPFVVSSMITLTPSFQDISILISILIGVVFLIYRFFYLLVILTKSTKFSYFHIFLYLCTLEILMVLIFYKALSLISLPF